MTWLRVIIFAVITGVYTGLINSLPFLSFLQDTSFRDIAINVDWWVLFAVFIVVNCKKPWEASLKCFVFFLISQPLVYLVESPFLGIEVFRYYYYWFIFTLLTLVGGFIAWYVKKSNVLSAIILSVACGLLGYLGVTYVREFMNKPPHHILSAIFCFAQIIFLIVVLMRGKKEKIIAFACTAVILCGFFGFEYIRNGGNTSNEIISNSTTITLDSSSNWQVQSNKNSDWSVYKDENKNNVFDVMSPSMFEDSTDEIVFVDDNGNTATYKFSCVSNKGLVVDSIEKGTISAKDNSKVNTTVTTVAK